MVVYPISCTQCEICLISGLRLCSQPGYFPLFHLNPMHFPVLCSMEHLSMPGENTEEHYFSNYAKMCECVCVLWWGMMKKLFHQQPPTISPSSHVITTPIKALVLPHQHHRRCLQHNKCTCVQHNTMHIHILSTLKGP